MHYRLISRLVTGLLLSITAAAMFGCSSSSKEGASAPITGQSVNGNVQVKINAAPTFAAGKATVTFAMSDENGAPVDVLAEMAQIPAKTSVAFTIARLEVDANGIYDYKNYIKKSTNPLVPGTEKTGVFALVSPGVYTYTFATDITDTTKTLGGIVLDAAAQGLTHTIGAQVSRTVVGTNGRPYTQASNPLFNFRPDGQAVAADRLRRELVAVSNCNDCHDRLLAHGSRVEVAFCLLCHYKGMNDTVSGNSIDLKQMVHKIHSGEKLPSVVAGTPYYINNATTHNFSDVANPFMSRDPRATTTPIDCVKCHRLGTDENGKPYGKQADNWKDTFAINTNAANLDNCSSCHDTLLTTGTYAALHNGIGATTCVTCHTSSNKYAINGRANAVGAHVFPEQKGFTASPFTGLNIQILKVENAQADSFAKVTIRATDNAGNVILPTAFDSISAYLGYQEQTATSPATDYLNQGLSNFGQPLSLNLKTAVPDVNGAYTFTGKIPAGKVGVGVINIAGRKLYTITTNKDAGVPRTATIAGGSDQYYFDLATGAQVADPNLVRRIKVVAEKCDVCHYRLIGHSTRADDIQLCVICHNPNAARAPFSFVGLTWKSIDMKYMVHRIHANVRYPKSQQNCLACHVDTAAIAVPLRAGVYGNISSTGGIADPLNISLTDVHRIKPTTEVCTACHNNPTSTNAALAANSGITVNHVANKVTGGVETCAQCHTSGLQLGPDVIHQIPK